MLSHRLEKSPQLHSCLLGASWGLEGQAWQTTRLLPHLLLSKWTLYYTALCQTGEGVQQWSQSAGKDQSLVQCSRGSLTKGARILWTLLNLCVWCKSCWTIRFQIVVCLLADNVYVLALCLEQNFHKPEAVIGSPSALLSVCLLVI